MSAPFAGVLVSAPISVSGVVLTSTDSFQLIDPNSLVFKAEVDEADIGKVRTGMTAKIRFDAYPDQEIQTIIKKIALVSSVGSSGTVFIVSLPIPNPDLSVYRLGMNGDVEIELATAENVLSIPLAATKENGGVWTVEIAKNQAETPPGRSLVGFFSQWFKPAVKKQTETVIIEPGLQTDDFVEVVKGLTETDQVVVPE